MYLTERRARVDRPALPPRPITTEGGLSILVLHSGHLARPYRDLPLVELTDARCLHPIVHADYYHADFVIVQGMIGAKYLKAPLPFLGAGLLVRDIPAAIKLLNDSSITKQTFQSCFI